MTIVQINGVPPSPQPTPSSEETVAAAALLSEAFAQPWWTQAACREVPEAGDLFFSEELPDIAAAKRICMSCPAMAECLEGALLRGEPAGVWGGQLFHNGKVLTQKRRRGRPPKNPRPEDQLPQVPVPEHLQRLIA
ncbi:MAG: WhiB family transcriptional regulator [Acidimicrobiales bacterium]